MSDDAADIIDLIYEAALVPDRWMDALDGICAFSGSAAGAMVVLGERFPARGAGAKWVHDKVQEFLALGGAGSVRVQRMASLRPTHFVHVEDYLSAEEYALDPSTLNYAREGVGPELCSAVPMPTGEIATFAFQRWIRDGRHPSECIARLNALRPHLARSAVLAARLGLQQLQAATEVLQAIGLPTAVLARDGRVLASNALLDASKTVLPAAFGRVKLVTHTANALLQDVLNTYAHKLDPPTSSIPVPASSPGRAASVIHVLPLHGLGRDLFTRAAVLLIEARFGAGAVLRDLSVLHGLFDLTPKEAQLAVALSDGGTLKGAAEQAGVNVSTARSHLERVFAKTGVHQQSQLVALLRSLPLVPDESTPA